ncbi:MAG: paraquat-inducible protein B [Oleiphilaceae bacterium]|jgi:paraquat-inducible protein B
MSDNTPTISPTNKVSPIWIVPFIALLIAGWLALKTWQNKGPEVQIIFDDAAGIIVGKTHVKFRDVVVGKVTNIKLTNDFQKVTTLVELDPQVESLVSEFTRFWVVSPRISLSGVSGLDTLLSGVYIEMDPGERGKYRSRFEGLTEPPSVRSYQQGTQYTLLADELGSLGIASPVYHRQIPVGEVTRYRLLPDKGKVEIRIFINSPHDKLIRTNTKFWNVSGINFEIGTDGIIAKMETLSSLVSGGLAFNTTSFSTNKTSVANSGSQFYLFNDQKAVAEGALTISFPYILRLDSSVRGLVKDAPVEFRGIQVGKVEHVGLNYGIGADKLVNVVISIQPERVNPSNTPTLNELNKLMENLVSDGMRAKLKPRNILTGSLYIDLIPNHSEPTTALHKTLNRFNEYWVLPSSKNEQLQLFKRVSDIAQRIEQIPFESISNNLNNSLHSTAQIVEDINKKKIVNDLNSLLISLNGSSDSLANTLETMQYTLQTIDQAIAPDSAVHYQLLEMLKDVSAASSSMKAFSEQLSRNPSTLILGRDEVK